MATSVSDWSTSRGVRTHSVTKMADSQRWLNVSADTLPDLGPDLTTPIDMENVLLNGIDGKTPYNFNKEGKIYGILSCAFYPPPSCWGRREKKNLTLVTKWGFSLLLRKWAFKLVCNCPFCYLYQSLSLLLVDTVKLNNFLCLYFFVIIYVWNCFKEALLEKKNKLCDLVVKKMMMVGNGEFQLVRKCATSVISPLSYLFIFWGWLKK